MNVRFSQYSNACILLTYCNLWEDRPCWFENALSHPAHTHSDAFLTVFFVIKTFSSSSISTYTFFFFLSNSTFFTALLWNRVVCLLTPLFLWLFFPLIVAFWYRYYFQIIIMIIYGASFVFNPPSGSSIKQNCILTINRCKHVNISKKNTYYIYIYLNIYINIQTYMLDTNDEIDQLFS